MVSRGIGRAQQSILDMLNQEREIAEYLSVPEIAQRMKRSQRQIRRAVHSLEDRGLVMLTKASGGWQKNGYGVIRPRNGKLVIARSGPIPIGPTIFVWLTEVRINDIQQLMAAFKEAGISPTVWFSRSDIMAGVTGSPHGENPPL